MTAPPTIPGLRPEPDRDGWGRYLLPHPETGQRQAFTRATTLAHTLDNTEPLTKWKRRMVLQGAAADPTLLTHVAGLADALTHADGVDARDLKQALDEICDQAAHVAGADDGSGWGTALHTVTEYHDAGRLAEIEVPVDLIADIAAYEKTLTEARISRPAEHIERIVVNTQVGTAGTYDRLVRLPDGRLVVGDLKSQQKIWDWLAIAIQLAQYANADAIYNDDTGNWEPVPDDLDMTRGLIIHLPARSGACQLYEVDLVRGWEAAQVAHRIRALRSDARNWGWKWTPPQQGELAIDGLLSAIQLAPNPDTLIRLWRNHHTTWTPEHTAAAAHRKQQLTRQVAA